MQGWKLPGVVKSGPEDLPPGFLKLKSMTEDRFLVIEKAAARLRKQRQLVEKIKKINPTEGATLDFNIGVNDEVRLTEMRRTTILKVRALLLEEEGHNLEALEQAFSKL